jgi:hypothetical protein
MAIAPVGAAATSIAGLPVAALRLDADTQNGLGSLAFGLSGSWQPPPGAADAAVRAEVCRRLDSGMAGSGSPSIRFDARHCRSPAGISRTDRGSGTLHRYTRKLVTDLAGILEEPGLGARRRICCSTASTTASRRSASDVTPTRDLKRLTHCFVTRSRT